MYIVEIYFVEIYYVYIYECICSSPTQDKANVNQHQIRRDLFVFLDTLFMYVEYIYRYIP